MVSAAKRRPLRLLVAADKFKGSLSGPAACGAIAGGFRVVFPPESWEIRELPVADGGEGLARAIIAARGGRWVETVAADPLGRPVAAGYGLIEGGATAVMEMAEASGLWRLQPEERDPWRAGTRGTGELIRHAVEAGAERILLGLGGSATNDGGVGLASALGIVFRDAAGAPIVDLPAELGKVARIDCSSAMPLPPVTVACDVTNPLLGPQGCTQVYGPQKGIAATDLARHESRLSHLVSLLGGAGAAAARTPGSGAAGGLGFGCLVFLQGELRPGFDLVADALDLGAAIAWADLVVTGEGRLDESSLHGKAPVGVARLARRLGKPVAALAGTVEAAAERSLAGCFDFVAGIDCGDLPPGESLQRAAVLLAATARRHAPALAALAKR